MNNKEKSPFTPGSPVPYELFVGRESQIREVLKYIRQSSYGKQENVFLSADRGIGKSSLASFLRYYVSRNMNMVGIHAFLGGVSTPEEMVRNVLDQLLNETKGQTWFKTISDLFGDYVREIGLFGISVSFNPPQQRLTELTRKFPEALNNLLKRIREQRAGLFIALDDINGLAGKLEFANWYKSFVDEIATHYKDFPVFIVLVGLPEKRDTLSNLQPSLMRIFRVLEIENLSDEEVRQFLDKAFDSSGMKFESKAMDLMVRFSSGLPILMHEIGDATFWKDKDGSIDEHDARAGIIEAANRVGEKYLGPKVYRAIQSRRYRSILAKSAEIATRRNFTTRQIEAILNGKEKKVFHHFLRRFRDLGVINRDPERGRGAYKFANEIYPVYIRMESIKPQK
jgi:Cdc6-like AAA superfamily ATPase